MEDEINKRLPYWVTEVLRIKELKDKEKSNQLQHKNETISIGVDSEKAKYN